MHESDIDSGSSSESANSSDESDTEEKKVLAMPVPIPWGSSRDRIFVVDNSIQSLRTLLGPVLFSFPFFFSSFAILPALPLYRA